MCAIAPVNAVGGQRPDRGVAGTVARTLLPDPRRAGVEDLTPIAPACSPALPRRFAVEGAPDSLREAVDADVRRPPARPL
jgi:hypothetical protein